MYNNYEFMNATFSTSFSHVIVTFKDEHLVPIKHFESYNRTDFIAIAGSLISLFMGASLLSIIEMFYYLTVRIHSAYRTDHRINPIIRIEPPPSPEPLDQRIRTTAPNQIPVFTFLP